MLPENIEKIEIEKKRDLDITKRIVKYLSNFKHIPDVRETIDLISQLNRKQTHSAQEEKEGEALLSVEDLRNGVRNHIRRVLAQETDEFHPYNSHLYTVIHMLALIWTKYWPLNNTEQTEDENSISKKERRPACAICLDGVSSENRVLCSNGRQYHGSCLQRQCEINGNIDPETREHYSPRERKYINEQFSIINNADCRDSTEIPPMPTFNSGMFNLSLYYCSLPEDMERCLSCVGNTIGILVMIFLLLPGSIIAFAPLILKQLFAFFLGMGALSIFNLLARLILCVIFLFIGFLINLVRCTLPLCKKIVDRENRYDISLEFFTADFSKDKSVTTYTRLSREILRHDEPQLFNSLQQKGEEGERRVEECELVTLNHPRSKVRDECLQKESKNVIDEQEMLAEEGIVNSPGMSNT